jgi:DtxR family Mn-dependent transcriptional regulator
MLPSTAVENYLKRIYLCQLQLPPDQLVPMGQLASAMGVAPGTATTMIKALAEAGLVQYEPYSGVRLLPAGERLAAMVLRRHRLVELFLVEVMGMSWAEVHEEAEQLEHVVSERLIERIDDMLGHPQVDPHGDPIPGPEGTVAEQDSQTLLTCPLNHPVTVTRVTDQNAAFLNFLEESQLKPGQRIEVEARDTASDSVRVRVGEDQRVTIGTRAASKLLVHAASVLLFVLGLSPSLVAQESATPASPSFAITDNSFLVEEAFNQEANIFQNILGFVWTEGGDWELAFTQEWPLGGMSHQFSYTVLGSGDDASRGWNDVLINYRYQALVEGPGRPAFSPRVSLVLPTGDEITGRGEGVVGVQVNLPFSKQVGDFYLHGNVGFVHSPGVRTELPDREVSLTTPTLGGSVIWRMKPMMHLLFESVASFPEFVSGGDATDRDTAVTFSPGVRVGWNVGDQQLVMGLAVPVTTFGGDTFASGLGYFSYELPFRR